MSNSYQEGYSTVRPPLFKGENFSYWKNRMECYLKSAIKLWFTILKGYTPPTKDGTPLEPEDWTPPMIKKAQLNYKAINTIQCRLTI